ncbi:MAG: flagellar biosynthesis protein FliQ [Rhodospirillaceae bacterium]|nr:flagellar biosynthesis protein FliQ [Rhodospirillaceae bacterium]MBT3627262.1 flagellar biosynthesis protein FliQ [Rhodospirillaceae bacterium]MBT5676315.1 flagellar biosynthesis protein FliQ [Rhodospirillaceae bacterium]MBT5777972.1 flagellar biosynthesis protein FliQ [Rhodospirillaceae bacterium]MBT6830062.1 flagellar biosynthesis protein FliQ [Rhodospirillaceae bacterium]
MNTAEVVDIGREAIYALLKMGGPIMAIALVVGLLVSLFQALTQIQEMTLTFVPKIIVIFLAVLVMLPFMISTLMTFSQGLFDRIATGG